MSLKKAILDRDKAYTKTTSNLLKPFKTKLNKVAVQLLDNSSKIEWKHIYIDDAGTVAVYGLINFELGDTFFDINTDEMVTITEKNMQEHSHYVNLTIPVKNLETSSVEEIVEIVKENSKDTNTILNEHEFDTHMTRH